MEIHGRDNPPRQRQTEREERGITAEGGGRERGEESEQLCSIVEMVVGGSTVPVGCGDLMGVITLISSPASSSHLSSGLS